MNPIYIIAPVLILMIIFLIVFAVILKKAREKNFARIRKNLNKQGKKL